MQHKRSLTEVQAWILSYMTGLAPVGEEFMIPKKWVPEDLEGMNGDVLQKYIFLLEKVGAVKRVKYGKNRKSQPYFIVLKRPEEFIIRDSWLTHQRIFGAQAIGQSLIS